MLRRDVAAYHYPHDWGQALVFWLLGIHPDSMLGTLWVEGSDVGGNCLAVADYGVGFDELSYLSLNHGEWMT